MKNRVIIEHVRPEIDNGQFFIKRIPGEWVEVSADIFGDGHDHIRASLLFKHDKEKNWQEVFMEDHPNDVWTAKFQVEKKGFYSYRLIAWVDHLLNWHEGFKKKYAADQDLNVELQIGAKLLLQLAESQNKTQAAKLQKLAQELRNEGNYDAAVEKVVGKEFGELVQEYPLKQNLTTYDKDLKVRVGWEKELFSTWYEVFPRSTAENPGQHGTFRDCERLLPRVAELGFDVLYFPPIHPIGKKNRKGKNNSVIAEAVDPGSPWAIGSDEGGHKDINPALGTLDDYKRLLKKAKDLNIDLAFDLAFQCAPDHPYIKEHPEWFLWRPDGSIAYAENPPKKYQDIVPLNFESDDWENLWNELKSVILYWCEVGVRIFRVDNPHTKPFRFWEWAIAEVQKKYPDTIFLAEAFTRPKVMAQLAKAGYSQSYSYFTWRTTKKEMEEYLTELTQTESREYFRPNFWPNTPDILPYELMHAGPNNFIKRLILAATLSSNYGMYAPAYEFMENTPTDNGKEEYHNSEKYETRYYDWSYKSRISEITALLNRLRKENPALQTTWNIHFTRTDNDQLMSYVKKTEDNSNIIWCIVNFDANNIQSGYCEVPKALLGIERSVNLKVTDLLTGEVYHWFNDWNYVSLNPNKLPAHILLVEK
ncbi:MAG TPA: alpha-1,4-glucan--maltose-1-phosphate maltosyltransferase [Saprospiraceae bacterium]|nr:alpha-1,4-glucan--maltose-1-phosphate maltosyltransferase [Saprospiraceae bacterium]HMQ81543.1 alpha-1,4-glucan--maltose-1-phosphate maltosyltransferase [Saprospiraceae bacterium]